MAIPRFRAAPALVMGSAAALLVGVASAGMFGPDKPVSIFSDDTEMKSVTGKLVQIAVAPPPKQEVAPAKGKLPTMPENLAETPVFAPATAPTVAPPPRRAAPALAEVAEEGDVEPDYARAEARWRQIDSYDAAYADPPRYREPRWRPADRYDDAPRYEEPRYEDRYASRDRRSADRRVYVERYYEPPPYRYVQPRYDDRDW